MIARIPRLVNSASMMRTTGEEGQGRGGTAPPPRRGFVAPAISRPWLASNRSTESGNAIERGRGG